MMRAITHHAHARVAAGILPRAMRMLVACAAFTSSWGCVTTQTITDASPDPRDDLPAPTVEEAHALKVKERIRLEHAHPVVTVLELVPRAPIINMRVVFQAGSADDAPGREGTAAVTARLMREATTARTASELARALYPWAAELDVQVDKDTIVFSGRVHGDHAQAFSELFLDVILNPRLAPEDFERVRAEQRAALTTALRSSNDEALQREALESEIYSAPGHPYRHTPTGTVKGLDALTLDDVRAFIASHLTRDRVILGVSGGASPALVDTMVQRLGSLPFSTHVGGADERRAVPTPSPPANTTALLIDKPAAGTAISVGFALAELSRSHPDYPAMKLAETWFGEHRNLIGHLFNSMREQRGLNYGDYAYIEHFQQEGWSTYERLNIPRRTQYFSMWIRPVQHKHRMFALRQALWELDKFARAGIPDDESFERAQSFVQGYWRAKEQEPMRRLGYRIDEVLTGAAHDRDGLRAAVAKLTRDEVNAAIRRHLRADRLSIVVVTQDAAALRAEMLAGRPSPLGYAAQVPETQRTEDDVIQVFPLNLDAAGIRAVPATTLFED